MPVIERYAVPTRSPIERRWCA